MKLRLDGENGKQLIVRLPVNFMDKLDEIIDTEWFVSTKQEAIMFAMMKAYPELKVKQNETKSSNQES